MIDEGQWKSTGGANDVLVNWPMPRGVKALIAPFVPIPPTRFVGFRPSQKRGSLLRHPAYLAALNTKVAA
jgi:hypothetical protein